MEIVIRKFQFMLVLVLVLILVGCTLQSESTLITELNNLTPTAIQSMKNRCIRIDAPVVSEKTSSFYWSEDSKYIYFKRSDSADWRSYSLSLQKMEEETPTIKTEPPSIVSIINDYLDLFISPDQSNIVYTVAKEGGAFIFFMQKDKWKPILLGSIKGRIDQSNWFAQGQKLLLSIDWLSPLGAPEAYIYLVDLHEKNVRIVIPQSEKFQDISYFGITPDEQKVLFINYSKNNRVLELWNITTNLVEQTTIGTPITYRWIPGYREKMVVIGYLQNSLEVNAFSYDLISKEMNLLLSTPIEAHPFVKNSAQISPNLKWIAFIDESQQYLYLLECEIDWKN